MKPVNEHSIAVCLMGLCLFFVSWRDFQYAELTGEGPSDHVVALVSFLFFAAIRFTSDTSINLVKAIKVVLIIGQQQHNTSTAV
jgi:hypothetical protein